jgi:hypothetical protein
MPANSASCRPGSKATGSALPVTDKCVTMSVTRGGCGTVVPQVGTLFVPLGTGCTPCPVFIASSQSSYTTSLSKIFFNSREKKESPELAQDIIHPD